LVHCGGLGGGNNDETVENENKMIEKVVREVDRTKAVLLVTGI
jgi:hypothetical protein